MTNQKLQQIVNEKRNAFVLCKDPTELDAIKAVFCVEFESKAHLSFPFVLRVGHGKAKSVIPADEMPGGSPIEEL